MSINSKNIRYYNIICFVGVVLCTLLAYLHTFQVGFVWDDFQTIYQHLPGRGGSLNFLKGFSHRGYFRPTQTLFFMIDFSIWHRNSFGYHITNFLFHLLNTLLVTLLVWRIIEFTSSVNKENGDKVGKFFIAWASGLLFGLHPIHTESVNWISARTDLICTTFFLLSIVCYVEFRSHKRFVALFPCLVFSFFAFGAKETAVVLPLVIASFELFCGKNWKVSALIVGLCLVAQLLVLWARFPAIKSIVQPYFSSNHSIIHFLKLAIASYGFYILKLLWPVNLNLFIGAIPKGNLFLMLSFGLITLLVLIALFCQRRAGFVAFFAVWILITILPHEIILLGGSAVAPVAERYLYLPSVGFCILLSSAIFYMVFTRYRALGYGAILAIMVCYFTITFSRSLVWADPVKLWGDTVRKSPEFGLPYQWYGNALYKQGQTLKAIEVWKKGLQCPYMTGEGMDLTGIDAKFRKSLFHTSIALALMKLDNYERARAHLIKAIKFYQHYKSYFLLGMIERRKAELSNGKERELRLKIAMKLFEISINLNPNYQEALYYAALTAYKLGKLDIASTYFEKTLKLNPRTNMAINAALFLYKIHGYIPPLQ